MADSSGSYSYRVTGLMSGSSLDGVDLAYCKLSLQGEQWSYQLGPCETLPYPPSILKLLKLEGVPGRDYLEECDRVLGEHYGKLLREFHFRHGIRPELIASHGHTLVHEPEKRRTFQAGDGQRIATHTGLPVICDFRREDVLSGGQGAPLVPIGDRLLFGQYQACLNLGGIANLSYTSADGPLRAYDICACNMALNHIAGIRGLDYDKDGALARRGKVDRELLDELGKDPYYKKPPPKSLGREWFELSLLPKITSSRLTPEDLMATLVEFIALQIASELPIRGKVLVSGGGALNLYLTQRLSSICSARIVIPDETLISYKEALIFALLGVLRSRGEVNVLAEVTGGARDRSAGIIYKP